MSDPLRIALVGATGLIGRALIEQAVGREDVRILAIARREMKLPGGAHMELIVAEPAAWGDVLDAVQANVLVSALGTTWKQAGKDEAAFRAVDHDLVRTTAQAALRHGAARMIAVSSVGAQIGSRSFYLRVKGQAERDLRKIGFDRLDILRPGLLRGTRKGDARPVERMGMLAAPITDRLLHGQWRKYRSIRDRDVARAALALSMRKAGGKFVHEHDSLIRAACSLPIPEL